MVDESFYESGLEDFTKTLERISDEISDEKVLQAIQFGADEYVNDVKALPKPRSAMSGGGYTHLLDSFTSKNNNKEIETGWGKYYGPMVERGTRKMSAQPHAKPLFEKNKNRYYKTMIEHLGGLK